MSTIDDYRRARDAAKPRVVESPWSHASVDPALARCELCRGSGTPDREPDFLGVRRVCKGCAGTGYSAGGSDLYIRPGTGCAAEDDAPPSVDLTTTSEMIEATSRKLHAAWGIPPGLIGGLDPEPARAAAEAMMGAFDDMAKKAGEAIMDAFAGMTEVAESCRAYREERSADRPLPPAPKPEPRPLAPCKACEGQGRVALPDWKKAKFRPCRKCGGTGKVRG